MSELDLEPGEVFEGRYRIERLLGQGHRKQTYLAHDTRMGRVVAISIVKPEAIASDPEGTKRETEILGRVGRHENIVSQYDIGWRSDGTGEYLVFEYLPGGTLIDHLEQSGEPSFTDILRIAREVCSGLVHLHAKGLIHRDLSPANVWLDDRRVAHIGDFDSAVYVNEPDGVRPTATNPFAPPEERGGGSISVRSDLYSLGGVLYVFATGKACLGDADDLRSMRPDVPTAFGDLVGELISERPEDRPASAAAVLERLDAIDRMSDLPSMLASGEGETMEWKSSLHHPIGPLPQDLQGRIADGKMQPNQANTEVRERLKHAVTKTVAAFLNSGGGTLLVGVDDEGKVLGIEHDFPHCQSGKQNGDGWQLSLKTLLTHALGGDIWSAVNVSLVPHEGKTVAVIRCEGRRVGQTWHESRDGCEKFYVRAGSATEELTGRRLLEYVRERWPTG